MSSWAFPLTTEVATAPPPNVLRLDGVSFGYGRSLAVDSLGIRVGRGQNVGLVGPNGSGKTTTLQICAGLLRPLQGTLDFGHGPRTRATLRDRYRLAYVPDSPAGFDHLKVKEYFQLYGALQQADPGYVDRALGFADVLTLNLGTATLISELSHGNRRKVSLAAAAGLMRPLTLIDEATAALDPETVIALESLMSTFCARGLSFLLATQDLYFAERACDAVYILAAGRIVDSGSPAALVRRWDERDLMGVFGNVTGYGACVERIESLMGPPAPE